MHKQATQPQQNRWIGQNQHRKHNEKERKMIQEQYKIGSHPNKFLTNHVVLDAYKCCYRLDRHQGDG